MNPPFSNKPIMCFATSKLSPDTCNTNQIQPPKQYSGCPGNLCRCLKLRESKNQIIEILIRIRKYMIFVSKNKTLARICGIQIGKRFYAVTDRVTPYMLSKSLPPLAA
jgi:hypothetical protein